MEFERNTTRVKIYGKEYVLTRPTVRQAEEIGKAVKKIEDDTESVGILIEAFESFGLPKDVSYDMQEDHFVTLVKSFLGKKK